MRYATAAAFRQALEQRLQIEARARAQAVRAQGKSGATAGINRLRKLVAFDRLLARLVIVAPDRWVLKGGLALDYRLRDRARATLDVDLHRDDDESAADADFRAAQQLDLGDYFDFVIERSLALDTADVACAVRYHVRCELASRRFDEFAVDVGFADPPVAVPDELRGHDLLAFAGLPSVAVPALPLPRHVAEKVHAYTRTYGVPGPGGRGTADTKTTGGRPSTRVKDLVDLVLIAGHATMGATELWAALRETFGVRGTHPVPAALPPPPGDWAARFRTYAVDLGIPPALRDGYVAAARFLDPVLGGALEETARWDPARGIWND